MGLDPVKRSNPPPKPEAAPEPAPAAAPARPATPGFASGSEFEAATPAPVALNGPTTPAVADDPSLQTPATSATPETLARSLEQPERAGDPVATTAEGVVPEGTAGAATEGMSEEEQTAYEALPPQDRARYDAEHSKAQRSGDPEQVENLQRALTEGITSQYLNAKPEERAEIDSLLDAAAEAGDPEEATAAVVDLVKTGKVADYMAVKATASDDAALQELLFNGKLTGSTDGGGQTMLDNLAEFVRGPGEQTSPAQVNRQQLVDQIVSDVHTNSVTQPEGDRNCGPLAVLGEFAREAPAEYTSKLTELAETGQTTVTDAQGNPVTLEYRGPPGSVTTNDGESLTMTEEIFVESFGRHVDQAMRQGGIFGFLLDGFNGMNAAEVAQLREYTSGADYEAMTVPEDDEIDPNDPAQVAEQERLQQEAKQTIDEQLKAGEHPMVLIDGHWVRVTGKLTLPQLPFGMGGGGEVYLIDDGTGKPRIVGASNLTQTVESVVYNTEHSKVPEGSYNADWDGPGTGSKPGQGVGGGDF